MLTSNKLLQGSPGSCLRQALSHPVWLACSYLPKWATIKKNCCSLILTLQSRLVWKCLLYILKYFPPSSHHYSLAPLDLSALPSPAPIFSAPPSFFFLLFFSPSFGSVPTVPPGNVQVEAVNSTTVRFTWSAPSPQFINGINQGYKVSSPSRSTSAL